MKHAGSTCAGGVAPDSESAWRTGVLTVRRASGVTHGAGLARGPGGETRTSGQPASAGARDALTCSFCALLRTLSPHSPLPALAPQLPSVANLKSEPWVVHLGTLTVAVEEAPPGVGGELPPCPVSAPALHNSSSLLTRPSPVPRHTAAATDASSGSYGLTDRVRLWNCSSPLPPKALL